MIVLNKDDINNFVVNVSNNRTSTLSTYLIELEFDMSKHKVYFLSTNSSPYPERYDKFGVVLVNDKSSEDLINSVIYYSSGYGNYGNYTIYEYNGGELTIDLNYIVKTLEIGKFKVDFATIEDFMIANSVTTIISDNQFYIPSIQCECCNIAFEEIVTLYLENWVYNEDLEAYQYTATFTDHIGDYQISYGSQNEDYSFVLEALYTSQTEYNNEGLEIGQIIISYPTLPTEIIGLRIVHSRNTISFI